MPRDLTKPGIETQRPSDDLGPLPKFGQWISVEDRLPEHRQEVYYFFDYVGVCAGAYDAHDNVFYGARGFLHLDVTHWMPLVRPAAPEGYSSQRRLDLEEPENVDD